MGSVFPRIVCTFENMPSLISNFNFFLIFSQFLFRACRPVRPGPEEARVQGPELAWAQDEIEGPNAVEAQGHKHQRAVPAHKVISPHRSDNKNARHYSIFSFDVRIASSPTGETWRGKWQGNEIAAKILTIRECTPRISRGFNEEYPKLR